MVANPSFDLFQLSDEHNELRTVLRDLCEKEIEPHAADVDATIVRVRERERELIESPDSEFRFHSGVPAAA